MDGRLRVAPGRGGRSLIGGAGRYVLVASGSAAERVAPTAAVSGLYEGRFGRVVCRPQRIIVIGRVHGWGPGSLRNGTVRLGQTGHGRELALLTSIMIGMEASILRLAFDRGTLVVTGGSPEQLAELPGVQPDPRSGVHRAEARHYRAHRRASAPPRASPTRTGHAPTRRRRGRCAPAATRSRTRPRRSTPGGRPAPAASSCCRPAPARRTSPSSPSTRPSRPALVVTPTIDLLNQWYHVLVTAFGDPVGLIGGGSYDIQPLTVTTYDSAYIHLERWGDRFGLLVFDECHHLPGPTYAQAAVGSLAPFRLGLTATPERADGGEAMLPSLIGPIVYRREIRQLAGDFLADYRTERLYVELSPEEQERYTKVREQYRRFVDERGISFGGPHGWQRFIQETCRSPEGRAAFQAYREQKQIALAAPAKLQCLEQLIEQHRDDRILIFTYDNATVYLIARRFLVPAITHQTKTKERRDHPGALPQRRVSRSW